MVAEAAVWVDVEAAVRAWARDNVASVNRRVFFGANNRVAFPQIVLTRIGGPDDACLIQFDCWGATKEDSATVAADLATEADALARYTEDGTVLHGAAVEAIRWSPDPESDQPRHIVDVTFTATATASAGS
jgi:hypothetical protein